MNADPRTVVPSILAKCPIVAAIALLSLCGCPDRSSPSGPASGPQSTANPKPALTQIVVEDVALRFRYPEGVGRLIEVSDPNQIPRNRRGAVVVEHPRHSNRPGTLNVVDLSTQTGDKLTGAVEVQWLSLHDFAALQELLSNAIDTGEEVVYRATWKNLRQRTGTVVAQRAMDAGADRAIARLERAVHVATETARGLFTYAELEEQLRRDAHCTENEGQYICFLRPYRTLLAGTIDYLFVVRATTEVEVGNFVALGFDDPAYRGSMRPTRDVPIAFDGPALILGSDGRDAGLLCRGVLRSFGPTERVPLRKIPIDWPEPLEETRIWTATGSDWVWLQETGWQDMAFAGAMFRGGTEQTLWLGPRQSLRKVEIDRIFSFESGQRQRFLLADGTGLVLDAGTGRTGPSRATLELPSAPAPMALRDVLATSNQPGSSHQFSRTSTPEEQDEVRAMTVPALPKEALPRVGLCQLLDRSW